VIVTLIYTDFSVFLRLAIRRTFFALLVSISIITTVYAQTNLSQPDDKTLIVEDAPESEIFALGKTVIIKKSAKGVLSLGGDVIIEGRVEGDAATIGGSITQKEGAFVGGEVIVFGGTYQHEDEQPLRNAEKETVVLAVFEDELRDMMQNPSQIFAPSVSWSFFAQRLLSVLFWFLISLGLATIAPGAVSRAVARFSLSTLKVFAIGMAGLLLVVIGGTMSLSFLPNYLGAIVGIMAFALLMLGYVFGRAALQVSIGKRIQKMFLSDKKQSEVFSYLIGAFVITLLLSIPYLWTLTLLALFASSLGLVFTARSGNGLRKV
jgi:hypothetical protein